VHRAFAGYPLAAELIKTAQDDSNGSRGMSSFRIGQFSFSTLLLLLLTVGADLALHHCEKILWAVAAC